MVRLVRLRESLQEALWVAPVLGLLVAAALTFTTINLDDAVSVGRAPIVGFGGDASSASSILSVIASSMLSVLTLVFTLTIVAMQLATGFSPRLLRTFLSNRTSKFALAVFVTTFTYALLVLRETDEKAVPELSVTVAIVLVIFAVIVFVYFVSEIAQSLRVANILQSSGDATRDEIARAYGQEGEPGTEDDERRAGWREIEDREPDSVIHWPGEQGIVTALDIEGFAELANRENVLLELRLQVGDFLPFEAPALAIYGESDIHHKEISSRIALAPERSFRQDAAFGLRQLVDVAARALSPGVNDPTTAVQAIDQIHDVLARLGLSRLYSGIIRDEDGDLRVIAPVHTWEDDVRLAIEEIRLYSADSIQVKRRLRALLNDLQGRLPECRQPVLDEQSELLAASIDAAFDNEVDRDRCKLLTTSAGGTEGGAYDERKDRGPDSEEGHGD